jgi:hypothetical protein
MKESLSQKTTSHDNPNDQFASTTSGYEKVVRMSGRREIPKRHGANIINRADMAESLWISSPEPGTGKAGWTQQSSHLNMFAP